MPAGLCAISTWPGEPAGAARGRLILESASGSTAQLLLFGTSAHFYRAKATPAELTVHRLELGAPQLHQVARLCRPAASNTTSSVKLELVGYRREGEQPAGDGPAPCPETVPAGQKHQRGSGGREHEEGSGGTEHEEGSARPDWQRESSVADESFFTVDWSFSGADGSFSGADESFSGETVMDLDLLNELAKPHSAETAAGFVTSWAAAGSGADEPETDGPLASPSHSDHQPMTSHADEPPLADMQVLTAMHLFPAPMKSTGDVAATRATLTSLPSAGAKSRSILKWSDSHTVYVINELVSGEDWVAWTADCPTTPGKCGRSRQVNMTDCPTTPSKYGRLPDHAR
ncbi:hypothetical protein FJT64_018758 [Amphibalanus amphitrite]|uniref:Uncharacterized protein n=1 Tax=Amphibalanus amphitrite TaxID=1232801 RepID=A0A6A4X252_AMPAM|nr:hypothetical protein FJT64_018758 [Amphibalanus amphitrite]